MRLLKRVPRIAACLAGVAGLSVAAALVRFILGETRVPCYREYGDEAGKS